MAQQRGITPSQAPQTQDALDLGPGGDEAGRGQMRYYMVNLREGVTAGGGDGSTEGLKSCLRTRHLGEQPRRGSGSTGRDRGSGSSALASAVPPAGSQVAGRTAFVPLFSLDTGARRPHRRCLQPSPPSLLVGAEP